MLESVILNCQISFARGLLIATSTSTSYMGIFDGVVRPVERMEQQYTAYQYAVDIIVENQISSNAAITIEYTSVEAGLALIKSVREESNNIKIDWEKQKSGTQTTQIIPTSRTDRNGNVHYGSREVPVADGNNTVTDLDTKISRLGRQINKLDIYISTNPTATSILANVNNLINSPDKYQKEDDVDKIAWNEFIDVLNECATLITDIYPDGTQNRAKELSDELNINSAIEDNNKRNSLRELKLSSYDNEILGKTDNVDDPKDNPSKEGLTKKFLNFFYDAIDSLNNLVVSKDIVRAEEIRSIINKKTTQNYDKLSPLLSEENRLKLDNAKKACFIENTQLMPWTSFANPELLGEVLFSFLIAALVDLFSVLIAWTLINKQKSILYYKKVGDLRANREEMLEDCLIYICLNKVQEKQESGEKFEDRSKIQNFVVSELNKIMREFFTHIKYLYLSDELNAFAYIDPDIIDSFNEDEKRLFTAMNNVALLHPCHQSEIIKIIQNDFDDFEQDGDTPSVPQDLIDSYKAKFSTDKIYYIVSKNLHVWFCENFTELLQSSMWFELQPLDNSGHDSETDSNIMISGGVADD